MFNSRAIKELHIYNKYNYIFNGLDLGDMCYFLYDKHGEHNCKVVSHPDNLVTLRDLAKRSKFILSNIAESIVQKAESLALKGNVADLILKGSYSLPKDIFYRSAYYNLPFTGIERFNGCVTVLGKDDGMITEQFVPKDYPFKDPNNTLERYKLFLPKTLKSDKYFQAIIAEPMNICTDEFLVFGPLESELEAIYYMTYLSSKVIDFLIFSQSENNKISIDFLKLIPLPHIKNIVSDSDIYKILGLTDKEIKYIEEYY